MVTFILVRHGNSASNKAGTFTGQSDAPLTPLGIWQAAQTAQYIKTHFQIDRIYSSDLSRAMDTAKPISEALGMPIQPEKDLREFFLGCWQGKPLSEVKCSEPYKRWREGATEGIDDVESRPAFLKRCTDIVHKIALENEGKCVLLSTHGGFVNVLLPYWMDPEQAKNTKPAENASISVFQYDTNTKGVEISMIGYTEHLASAPEL